MSQRIVGVVLAAGKAERFPNKLLLPMDSMGRCLYECSLDIAKQATDRVIMVVEPDSIVRRVCEMRGDEPDYAVQPGYHGPFDAIQRAAAKCDENDILVVMFGDNWFMKPDLEVEAIKSAARLSSFASTRWVPTPFASQLDWINKAGEWSGRGNTDGRRKAQVDGEEVVGDCFAGWVILKAGEVLRLDPAHFNLLQAMNHLKVKPWPLKDDLKWSDLGTPAAYKRYLDR